MTEREKRESIITDIKIILCNACCEEPCGVACECVISEASTICDYILRKADEVRKETAEKIYKEINTFADKCIIEGDEFRDIATDFDYVKFFKWLDSFFKKFGVEIKK